MKSPLHKDDASTTQLPSTVPQALTAKFAFSFASGVMVPIYGMMMAAPRSRVTNFIVQSRVVDLGLGLMYCIMLWKAVQGGLLDTLRSLFEALMVSYQPNGEAIAAIFADGHVMALTWLHLLLLDFFQAREVLRDGLKNNIPTAHSLALCFMFGPIGLLVHLITRSITLVLRKPEAAPAS